MSTVESDNESVVSAASRILTLEETGSNPGAEIIEPCSSTSATSVKESDISNVWKAISRVEELSETVYVIASENTQEISNLQGCYHEISRKFVEFGEAAKRDRQEKEKLKDDLLTSKKDLEVMKNRFQSLEEELATVECKIEPKTEIESLKKELASAVEDVRQIKSSIEQTSKEDNNEKNEEGDSHLRMGFDQMKKKLEDIERKIQEPIIIEEIRKSLECLICLDIPHLPLFVCPSCAKVLGCFSCCKDLDICANCRAAMPENKQPLRGLEILKYILPSNDE